MKRILASIAVLWLMGSCSMSGGIGGTGGISGFGSIFVNGTEWFIDVAEIVLDGVPGSEEDLRLGMIVTFEGHSLAQDGTAIATRVVFDDAIEGPISAIEATSVDTRTLSMLGQTVIASRSSTQFDESDPSFGFDTLALDDVLEVSGHIGGAGVIHATWLRRQGSLVLGETMVELEGVVSGLAGTSSFALGAMTVLVGPEVDPLALDGLGNGLAVEVEGVLTAPLAMLAERISAPEGLPENVAALSLEGIVTDFADIADFRVVGQPIDATAAEFEPPDPSLLGSGMLVRVKGVLHAGVLVAQEVRFLQAEAEIRAELALASDVDPSAARLELLGVNVELAEGASLTDERDGVSPFDLEDLGAGDFLAVRGVSNPFSGLVATEVRRTETGDVLLRAPVTAVDAGSLELFVLGVPVPLDGQTRVVGSLGEFLASLWVGRVVEVVDESDSNAAEIDAASQIEAAD